MDSLIATTLSRKSTNKSLTVEEGISIGLISPKQVQFCQFKNYMGKVLDESRPSMHLDCTLPTLLQVQEGIKTRISSYNKIIDDQLAVAREKFAQDSIASRRADKVAAKKVPQRKLTM